MGVTFQHRHHPHIDVRRKQHPPKSEDQVTGVNGRIALALTNGVGTMWCAYAFAVLALVVLPQAIQGGLLTLIQWVSQTFIQLVMLSVIMVGQNILSQASDKRADLTYKDAEATFHEAEQIQAHLQSQDDAINDVLAKLEKLEAALIKRTSAPDSAAASPAAASPAATPRVTPPASAAPHAAKTPSPAAKPRAAKPKPKPAS